MRADFKWKFWTRAAMPAMPSLQATAEDLVDRRARPEKSGSSMNSTFRANVHRSCIADVDRVQSQGRWQIRLSEVFGTLQAYLGSAYVNDFTYEQPFLPGSCASRRRNFGPARPMTLDDCEVRNNARSKCCRFARWSMFETDFGPLGGAEIQPVSQSASINGSAAPGTSVLVTGVDS